MRKLNGKSIRTFCLSLAVALAASFVLAEMPGLHDGPPDMDRKMKISASGGVSSSAPAEHYIVALVETAAGDPAVQDAVIREVEAFGGTVYRRYSAVLNGGFAATLPTRALETLQSNPNVAFVEPDAIIGAPPSQTTAVNDDAATAGESGSAEADCFIPMSWGVDRIDQRSLPLDNLACFDSTGHCASVYVLDTGVRELLPCLGGSAQQVADFVGGPNGDCNGHGTYVAGVIHEIAPHARIYGVKVLNCMGSGTYSGVIAGIDWVTTNAGHSSIAVLALGGGASFMMDSAVNFMANAGIQPVVAAGNSDADACNYSPARASGGLTVAATTHNDSRASYSTYGPCVDVVAPGSDITSCGLNGGTITLSGTTPAVSIAAGALALYCGNVYELLANATQDAISDAMGSPNLLVYAD